MEPVEKDRIIEIQETRIGHLLTRIMRLEGALKLWANFYNNNEEQSGDADLFLAEEAMEETRLLLGDNI